MRHRGAHWPVTVQDEKGKTNWGAGGRPLQLLKSTWTEPWQLPSEELATVGPEEPFQITKSQWR